MYLLDTNICIFLIKNKFPNLTNKILSSDGNELFLSSISIAEMEYGASKSQNKEKNRQALLDFCTDFNNIIGQNSSFSKTHNFEENSFLISCAL